MRGMRKLQSITWDEVFDVWKQQEGTNPSWQKQATLCGWDSWEEWRMYSARLFDAQNREWHEYKIQEPLKTISHFYIGPFKTWQAHFDEPLSKTFKNLVEEKNEWVRNELRNYPIHEFPEKTQLIGIYMEDLDKIYLIEGHHRATSIALAHHNQDHVFFAENPTIAITKMNSDEMHVFEKMLELGSKNPNRLNDD